VSARTGLIVGMMLMVLVQPASAGPPYVSDDPEPTDYQHFEIYTFNSGTAAQSGISGASGIDFNYGAAPDLQLRPLCRWALSGQPVEIPASDRAMSNLPRKYRTPHSKDRILFERFSYEANAEDRLFGCVQEFHLPFGVLLEVARDAADQVFADFGDLSPRRITVCKVKGVVGRAGVAATANTKII
jgi:hypothetical protein